MKSSTKGAQSLMSVTVQETVTNSPQSNHETSTSYTYKEHHQTHEKSIRKPQGKSKMDDRKTHQVPVQDHLGES